MSSHEFNRLLGLFEAARDPLPSENPPDRAAARQKAHAAAAEFDRLLGLFRASLKPLSPHESATSVKVPQPQ
jgi:hypothetical protein